MDTPSASTVAPKYRIWLPFWAVFQTDLRQTIRGWTYRTWLLCLVVLTVGMLLYRAGLYREAKIVQDSVAYVKDVIHWVVLGSAAMIAALTVGCISSERGTLADAVLSRGISRYQYFLAKLYSRMVSVIGTFSAVGLAAVVGSYFLLNEQKLSLMGCFMALLTLSSLYAAVVACGVTISAFSQSTLMGMTILWMGLYGGALVMALLASAIPTPLQFLELLPNILQGNYDPNRIGQFIGGAAAIGLIATVLGITHFARSDV
jgi:hypothetical protein